jgi:hypothetical protein
LESADELESPAEASEIIKIFKIDNFALIQTFIQTFVRKYRPKSSIVLPELRELAKLLSSLMFKKAFSFISSDSGCLKSSGVGLGVFGRSRQVDDFTPLK